MAVVKGQNSIGSFCPFLSPNFPDISARYSSVDSSMNDTIMMPSVSSDASL
jgi:hypothetical protein